ncbi:MAG: glycosyltransferase family 4 protein [Coprobacter sp.]|nr:glycosyltransferase family 4 protein [Coprobacter sp.]
MKLLFCIPSMCGGGAERVMALVCNGLCARGHEVVLATDTAVECFYLLDGRIRVVSLYPPFRERRSLPEKICYNLFRLYPRIRSVIRQERPDAVVSFLYILNPKVLLASRFLNIPVVSCEHINFINGRTWLKTVRRIWINRLADRVTVLTQRDADYLQGRLNRVTVMPNPVSFPVCADVDTPRRKTVLAVGNLNASRRKGFPGLIEAWGRIAAKYPDWTLCIAGRGTPENRAVLESRIAASGAEMQIRLLGEVREMQPLYRESALFVLSSENEGFPMALVEAMSQGCACVSFDIATGPREIIGGDDDGVLVPAGDFSALAGALERLMSDEALRRSTGARAAARMQRFSLPAVLDRWESLLNEVVAEKGGKEVAG